MARRLFVLLAVCSYAAFACGDKAPSAAAGSDMPAAQADTGVTAPASGSAPRSSASSPSTASSSNRSSPRAGATNAAAGSSASTPTATAAPASMMSAAGAAGTPGSAAAGSGGQVAAAGSGGAAAGSGSTTMSADRTLPQVQSVDEDGPFEVTVDQQGGAQSWIFRPTELGKDGAKHPVFVFGNGAGGSPGFYMAQMRRIASHGIVVMHPTNAMVTAQILKAALDWVLAENERADSIFYQKLNGKAAAGGHSLGSLATFDLEATDTRLTTTLHIAGGSMDRMGSSKVKTITAYICGDTDIARENCEMDFEEVGSQPTFLSILDGTDHIPAVERALPGMIAWLRWQLAGESERKAQFTGPDGLFFQGIWKSQTKNW